MKQAYLSLFSSVMHRGLPICQEEQGRAPDSAEPWGCGNLMRNIVSFFFLNQTKNFSEVAVVMKGDVTCENQIEFQI